MINLNKIAEIKTGLVLSRKKAEAHSPSENRIAKVVYRRCVLRRCFCGRIYIYRADK